MPIRVPRLAAALVLGAAGLSSAVAGDDAAELAARRAALAAKSADLAPEALASERYALGLWARDHAMPEAAAEEFRAAVAAVPDHEPARAALGDVRAGDRWVTRDEAMALKGLVRRGGAWILREEAEALDLPAQERALRREQQAKVETLLRRVATGDDAQRRFAAAALGAVEDAHKVEPFAYALRSRSEPVRLLAARELGRIGDRRALKPLVRRALVDPSAAVRDASVDAAKAIGDPSLLAPFARALDAESPEIRRNAADGIVRLGDVRGVRILIWKFEAHGGTGQRVFSFFGTQLGYVQDFDVEVAQTAFIADPVVGVLQEGIVLDAQVHSADREVVWSEREVLHGAIARMTGATEVRNEPGAWAAWWSARAESAERGARSVTEGSGADR